MEIPEPAKKPTVNQYGSVDSGNAPNGHVPPYERSLTPILHDFTDLSMCYIPNGYPSAAYYFEDSLPFLFSRLYSFNSNLPWPRLAHTPTPENEERAQGSFTPPFIRFPSMHQPSDLASLAFMGSLMDNNSDDDISESEMDQFEDKIYEELKSGSQQVKLSDKTFTCPHCTKKRKCDYLYEEILHHASGVGKSTSDKRNAKEKACHLALMKYLEKDLGKMVRPVKPLDESGTLIGASHSDKFVCPWKGIVVNIPTTRAEDGRCVGESGTRLRDEFI